MAYNYLWYYLNSALNKKYMPLNFLKALKNMYLKSPFLKIFVFFFFILLIIIPLLVFGDGAPDDGYRLYANELGRKISYHSSLSNPEAIGTICLNNESSKSYFVPTRTLNEMNRFFAKSSTLNVDASPNCCGDFICDVSENPNDCPGDCGSAYVCPSSISISDSDMGSVDYPVVQIGRQCWLAKNLNVGAKIDLSSAATDNGQIQPNPILLASW